MESVISGSSITKKTNVLVGGNVASNCGNRPDKSGYAFRGLHFYEVGKANPIRATLNHKP